MHTKIMLTMDITNMGTPTIINTITFSAATSAAAPINVAKPITVKGNSFFSKISMPLVRPRKKPKNCTMLATRY
ncbi:MAG: hypothetical protein DRN01_04480 [Thermoplasmata archaeon]|nr:MAG: hypothetical protein DRN01_04480 [Thermoplasmata archaeon]